MKPSHLYRPLVSSCSTGHKPDNITLLNLFKKINLFFFYSIFVMDCRILRIGLSVYISKWRTGCLSEESASSTSRCERASSPEARARTGSSSCCSDHVEAELLSCFGLSAPWRCCSGLRHWSMFCRYCTCATFRDRKRARWLTPQLLPAAPPVNQSV